MINNLKGFTPKEKKQITQVLIAFLILFLPIWGCVKPPEKPDTEGFPPGTQSLIPTDLKTEYLENPLGIDIAQPRLFWKVESDARGQKQTAYQIQVASTKENLSNNNPDLWDSGKIISDQTTHIEYGGKPLDSNQECFWRVQVWDKDGISSNWSTPAFWTMGLMNSEWENSQWVVAPTPVPTPPIWPVKWGKAIYLDGKDFVDFGRDNILNPTGSYTIEAWIRPELSKNEQFIFSRSSSDEGAYEFKINASKSMSYKVGKRTTTSPPIETVNIPSLGLFNQVQWRHIAAVYDGRNITFYQNGEVVGVERQVGSVKNNFKTLLGARSKGDSSIDENSMFRGWVDEVRFWNTARTESEIKKDMRAPLAGDENGLSAYWNFDDDGFENSEWKVKDKKTRGPKLNGTLFFGKGLYLKPRYQDSDLTIGITAPYDMSAYPDGGNFVPYDLNYIDTGLSEIENDPIKTDYFRATLSFPIQGHSKDQLTGAYFCVAPWDMYRFYVDGTYVGLGKHPSNYDQYDITDLVKQTNLDNVLALKVSQFFVGYFRPWASCKILLTFNDNTTIVADGTDPGTAVWNWVVYNPSLPDASLDTQWKTSTTTPNYFVDVAKNCTTYTGFDSKHLRLPPVTYVRKEFDVPNNIGKIKRATVFTTALGFHELHINGQKINFEEGIDSYFHTCYTDYTKRILYNTFDVTDQIVSGQNAIGAVLADGVYSGYFGVTAGPRGNYSHQDKNLTPKFRCILQIEGTTGNQTIATDEGGNWKATRSGPIRYADIYMGESYDARMELGNWDTAGYNDSTWAAAGILSEGSPDYELLTNLPVSSYLCEAIITQEILPPIKSWNIYPGSKVKIFDLGENFAGWVRLTVLNGNSGDKIILRFAQRLNSYEPLNTETLFTATQRGAINIDTYICKGGKMETWEPNFTYHGFRYAEVKMLDSDGNEKDFNGSIEGVKIGSKREVTGSFTSSNPGLNQFLDNSIRNQIATNFDTHWDVPDRDERLGWYHNDQTLSILFNQDFSAFFTKYMRDITGDQMEFSPSGNWNDNFLEILSYWNDTNDHDAFPLIAPSFYCQMQSPDFPGWGDAPVLRAYNYYLMYGDENFMKEHYDELDNYMEFLYRIHEVQDNDPIYAYRGWESQRYYDEDKTQMVYQNFGDWLNLDTGNTYDSVSVLSTGYTSYIAKLMAYMSVPSGKYNDIISDRGVVNQNYYDYYMDLAKKVKEGFQEEYLRTDYRITDGGDGKYPNYGPQPTSGINPTPTPFVHSTDTQTNYAIALAFDLVDEPTKSLVSEKFIDRIEEGVEGSGDYANHFTIGNVGSHHVFNGLTKAATEDDSLAGLKKAYEVLTDPTYPSFLYMISQGATTIWEAWDNFKAKESESDPDFGYQRQWMRSTALEFMSGGGIEWLYTTVGGINPDRIDYYSNFDPTNPSDRAQFQPGFKKVYIIPQPDPRDPETTNHEVTSATATYQSIRGEIESNWILSNWDSEDKTYHTFTLNVTIPANSTGEIIFPSPYGDYKNIKESGHSISYDDPSTWTEGIINSPREGVLIVGSGHYEFVLNK